MKKLLLILFITCCFSKLSNAQVLRTDSVPSWDTGSQKQKITGDYLIYKSGKVMVMKNDKISQLQKDITLKNGTTVMTNGSVKTFDNKIIWLKEGDVVYFNGLISKRENKTTSP